MHMNKLRLWSSLFKTVTYSSKILYIQPLRSMKIYTKTGDKGTTALYTGERLYKDDNIFESLGSIDELNGLLGLVRYKF